MLASLVPHAAALLAPRTITTIDAPAAAADGAAVARVLDADGVVRITNALPHASEILALVNRTLDATLQQNQDGHTITNQPDSTHTGTQQQAFSGGADFR